MDLPVFKQEFHLKGIDLLPHRDPFLFVDELISADETGALGVYTYTDPSTAIPGKTVNTFFEGHFPFYPVVPGVVLIESMAQVAGCALVARKVLPDDPAFLLAAVDKVRFRRQVRPGEKPAEFRTEQALDVAVLEIRHVLFRREQIAGNQDPAFAFRFLFHFNRMNFNLTNHSG